MLRVSGNCSNESRVESTWPRPLIDAHFGVLYQIGFVNSSLEQLYTKKWYFFGAIHTDRNHDFTAVKFKLFASYCLTSFYYVYHN